MIGLKAPAHKTKTKQNIKLSSIPFCSALHVFNFDVKCTWIVFVSETLCPQAFGGVIIEGNQNQ